jgi:hypothetical protein
MDKLKIYKFQLEQIKDTLRLVANLLNSIEKETYLDRDIMVSIGMVDNALKGEIDNRVSRMY